MKEETGLQPFRFWVADFTSAFYEATQDMMNLVPVFAAEVKTKWILTGEEHVNFEWLPEEKAVAKVAWGNHKNAIQAISRMMNDAFDEKKWLEIMLNES